MSLLLRLIICVQVFSVLTVSADSYRSCGEQLNIRLKILCKTFPSIPVKRDDLIIPNGYDYFQRIDNENDNQNNYDNVDDRIAELGQHQRFERSVRGIVDECCRKPCSDSTLSFFYCA